MLTFAFVQRDFAILVGHVDESSSRDEVLCDLLIAPEASIMKGSVPMLVYCVYIGFVPK